MPRAMLGNSGSQADRLEKIEEARLAATSAAFLAEPLHRRREELITKLINTYRQGAIDHDLLIGTIGELSGIDNIMTKLDNIQLQGANAAEKEYNNA